MPIFSPIPMPQNAMDAFMTGMQHSQSMFDSFMKNKMTPYQIKLLEAQTLEAQGKGAEASMYAQIMNKYGHLNQPQNQSSSEPTMTGNAPAGTFPLTGGITAQGTPAQNPITQKPAEELPPQNPYISNNDTAPTQLPPAAQQQVNSSNEADDAERFGHSVIGAKMGVPAQTFNAEGKVGSIDPITGKVHYTQIGQTPEQKAQRDVDTANKKAQNSVNTDIATEEGKNTVKRKQQLIETGELLNQYVGHSEALTNLFDKNKNASGLGQAAKNYFGMGGGDAGVFNVHALPLVGELSKDLSSKGGAVVTGLSMAAKPNMKNQPENNIAILNELHKKEFQTYKAAKEEYERISGKPYPVKLSKFFDRVKVQSPNGHIVEKSPEAAKELIEKYPGSKIMGKVYE